MIKNSNKKINLLDCTFRDGGYYNNWEFNYKLINNYLKFIKKVSIKFVEIGFFTLKKEIHLGSQQILINHFLIISKFLRE